MIKKLQHRFIRIAVIALTAAMVLAVGVVNAANYITVRRELRDTVSLIAATEWNQGENGILSPRDDSGDETPPSPRNPANGETPPSPKELPDGETPPPPPEEPRSTGTGKGSADSTPSQTRTGQKNRIIRNLHNRNLINESAWFSVLVKTDGGMEVLDRRLLEESDESVLLALAQKALDSGASSGFIGDYAWTSRDRNAGTRLLVFMNCETRLSAVRSLALISGIACVGGILLALLITMLASRRAVQPTLKNMEQQKQFITNASHELKTPLTVISTNMELLGMELPDNQWVRSTQKQTGILRRLVDELVYLSRMEEENPPLTFEPLRLAPLLEETAEPFAAMAEFAGRGFRVEAEPDLWISGDRASVQRLMSTLCDNAVKYAGGDGDILVSARTEGRGAVISVSNPVAESLTREQCARLFDRFYRADPSRSKEKKNGFGIGLAIAAAIAENHGGAIRAAMADTSRLEITCTLPKCAPPDLKS